MSSACCVVELGLGTADGLIEIDLRGNMLTGSLPTLLAHLPIVVRLFAYVNHVVAFPCMLFALLSAASMPLPLVLSALNESGQPCS